MNQPNIQQQQQQQQQQQLCNPYYYKLGRSNAGNFLTSCKPVSFSRRTLHHGVSKEAGLQNVYKRVCGCDKPWRSWFNIISWIIVVSQMSRTRWKAPPSPSTRPASLSKSCLQSNSQTTDKQSSTVCTERLSFRCVCSLTTMPTRLRTYFTF